MSQRSFLFTSFGNILFEAIRVVVVICVSGKEYVIMVTVISAVEKQRNLSKGRKTFLPLEQRQYLAAKEGHYIFTMIHLRVGVQRKTEMQVAIEKTWDMLKAESQTGAN